MAANGVKKGTSTASSDFHKVATYQVTESAENREIQRIALNGPNGEELGSSSAQTLPVEKSLPTQNVPVAVVDAGAKTGWLIYNNSGVTLYMGFHSSVSPTIGIPIPNNGSYQQSGPGIFTGNVYLVATTNSKTARVQTW